MQDAVRAGDSAWWTNAEIAEVGRGLVCVVFRGLWEKRLVLWEYPQGEIWR